MLTIAKLIKIKVLLHQFWNLIINFNYIICFFKAKFRIKNIQTSFMLIINNHLTDNSQKALNLTDK